MHGYRDKGTAITVKESAEHLIEFKTQHLDAYQKAFQTHNKGVANYDNQYITNPAGHFCQCEHHNHHTGVNQDKRPNTQEGNGVAGIAQQKFKHFEKVLHNKLAPFFGQGVFLMLHKVSENLPEKYDQQGQDN